MTFYVNVDFSQSSTGLLIKFNCINIIIFSLEFSDLTVSLNTMAKKS